MGDFDIVIKNGSVVDEDILTYRYNNSKAVRWFSALAIWIFYTATHVLQTR